VCDTPSTHGAGPSLSCGVLEPARVASLGSAVAEGPKFDEQLESPITTATRNRAFSFWYLLTKSPEVPLKKLTPCQAFRKEPICKESTTFEARRRDQSGPNGRRKHHPCLDYIHIVKRPADGLVVPSSAVVSDPTTGSAQVFRKDGTVGLSANATSVPSRNRKPPREGRARTPQPVVRRLIRRYSLKRSRSITRAQVLDLYFESPNQTMI